MYYTDNRVVLKPNTKVFYNKPDAEQFARENRTYSAHGFEIKPDDTEGENPIDIWYVPK